MSVQNDEKESLVSSSYSGGTLFSRTLISLIIAGIIIVALVSGTFLSKAIQTDPLDYHRPYFLQYLGSSFMVLLLIPVVFGYYIKNGLASPHPWHALDVSLTTATSNNINSMRLFLFSGGFSILWIGANYLYQFSLYYTSGSSALGLEQCATVFVFIGSVIFLRDERITIVKVVCVLLCIAGALLVAFADYDVSRNNGIGDAIVVASTVFTAAYMICQKRFLNGISLIHVSVFLGFLGFWIIVVFWFPLFILNSTKVEIFSFPSGYVFGLIVVSSVIGIIFNATLNFGLIFTSPLFVRISIIMTIPVSFIVDLIISREFLWMKLLGSLVIVMGFVGFSIETWRLSRKSTETETIVQE